MKLWPFKYRYDAFIIHDVADRESITRKLCALLKEAGIKLWYSGDDLKPGDNVHQKIMDGLSKSRYGVPIISENSLESNWFAIELYELLPRAHGSRRRRTVLPVLHGLSMEALRKRIIVPDNIWIVSNEKDIQRIADTLIREIRSRPETFEEWAWENSRAISFWSIVMALCLAVASGYYYYWNERPPHSFVNAKVAARIADFQDKIVQEHALDNLKIRSTTLDTIKSLYTDFMALKSYYRNEYEFTNDAQDIRSRKNVEDALGISLAAFSPHNGYNLTSPQIYCSFSRQNTVAKSTSYCLLNSRPVEYQIVDSELTGDGRYEVIVHFKENIRHVAVNLLYPPARDIPKKHQVSIKGFLPKETYVFERKADKWELIAIE